LNVQRGSLFSVRRKRRATKSWPLLLSVSLVAGGSLAVSPTADAAEGLPSAPGGGSWTTPLLDDHYDGMMSHPTGEVSIGSCGLPDGLSPVLQYAPDGTLVGETLPSDDPPRMCGGSRILPDVDGTFHVASMVNDWPVVQTYVDSKLVRTTKIWRQSGWLDFAEMAIGPDSMIYGYIWDGRQWGAEYGERIFGLDGKTGKIVFERQVTCCRTYGPWLKATADGFVVHYPDESRFVYYDRTGKPTGVVHKYDRDGYSRLVFDFEVTPAGVLSYAVVSDRPEQNCEARFTRSLAQFNPTDRSTSRWKLSPRDCIDGDQVRVLPDNSIVTWADTPSRRRGLVFHTKTDGTMEDITPDLPGGLKCRYHSSCVSQVSTDAFGNIAVVQPLETEIFNPDAIVVTLLGSAGEMLGQSTVAIGKDNYVHPLAIATGVGWIDVLINENGADGYGARLYHLLFGDAGLEYPKAELLGIVQPPSEALTYVALGDSYASGQGVKPYWAGSAWNPDVCRRSKLAYPQVLNKITRVIMRGHFACRGAVADNVWDVPQHDGYPVQIEGLRSVAEEDGSAPDLVTLTIGGNDVAFGSFAVLCVDPVGSCSGEVEQAMLLNIEQVIPVELPEVLSEIQAELGPDSTLQVVGYPYLTPASESSTRTDGTCAFLTLDERDAARRVVERLNEMINFEVVDMDDARIQFLDPTEEGSPFLGHELCTDQTSYFFGATKDDKGMSSFHPNALGQNAYAEFIASELDL
jgi:hypothetical protein